MPTREPIANTSLPAQVEKPIPTRTVSTRPQKLEPKIAGQPLSDVSPAADSAAPEESVKLSPQLSALARKEQAYRQREQALKEKERLLEQKLKEAEQFEALKAKLSAKDYSEAEALGLDYDAYTQYKLDKANGEDPVQQELKALRDEVAKLRKTDEETAASRYEETIAEYKKEITKLVAESADFSTIKAFGREDAVLQLILDSFEEDSEELTVMEAAKLVEEQLEKYGKVYATLPKFKKEEAPVEPRALPRPVVGKTLTNNMIASADTKRATKSLQHLSDQERYEEARRRVLERRQKG